MVNTDGMKVKTILDVTIYRNQPLKDWIDENFESEILRGAAWATVAFIKETWPEKAEFLRGDPIYEGRTEG